MRRTRSGRHAPLRECAHASTRTLTHAGVHAPTHTRARPTTHKPNALTQTHPSMPAQCHDRPSAMTGPVPCHAGPVPCRPSAMPAQCHAGPVPFGCCRCSRTGRCRRHPMRAQQRHGVLPASRSRSRCRSKRRRRSDVRTPPALPANQKVDTQAAVPSVFETVPSVQKYLCMCAPTTLRACAPIHTHASPCGASLSLRRRREWERCGGV